ncbi:MAG: DUF3047 domain-containing protein [Candidatus Omnitrophica bacterium]|nr:DUF3047 domain-containing protein [Candidatus Omnitrophota bacterium]
MRWKDYYSDVGHYLSGLMMRLALPLQKKSFVILLIFGSILAMAGFVSYFFKRGEGRTVSRFTDGIESEFDYAELELLQDIGFRDASDLGLWKVHRFEGQSRAEMIREDEMLVLDVESSGTSSLLLKEANVSMLNRPHLTWEWKVLAFPAEKENKEFGVKRDSDYGARVYAIFKGLTPFTSETIQYIWDDHFPAGTHRASPAAGHIKLLVVRSGLPQGDGWAKETRDIFKDYEMLFGRKPSSSLHAVGIMSDSDNTDSSSHAQFRNVQILVPRGMKAETVSLSQNPVRAAIFSFGEHLLFLKKANEAGLTFIKERSNGFFSTIAKFRGSVLSRFPLSEKLPASKN